KEIDVRVSARLRHPTAEGRRAIAERATIDSWLADSDVAILYGRGDYPGFNVDKLLPLSVTPICSPKLVTDPEHPLLWPRDLEHHLQPHLPEGNPVIEVPGVVVQQQVVLQIPRPEERMQAAGVTGI